MLQLKTDNAGVAVEAATEAVRDYTNRLREIRRDESYAAAEASLHLADDDGLLIAVRGLIAKKVTANLKYSIVVGIGGSNLGAKAVYDARLGYRDLLEPNRFPKMICAETTDPEMLQNLQALVKQLDQPDEILVSLISKSGGTTETLANFEIIMETLRAKFGDEEALARTVVITDENSKLWKAAHKQAMDCLAIPTQVGGRYSVLSAVGLFPLASVGIDIATLRIGAQDVLDVCLTDDQPHTIAALSAYILAEQLKQGRTINDNFMFHPELESVGKWYRQLMGESVGKAQSLTGETVHTGITPTVSLGSTDLHSVGQLYLGGPKDKFTTFVSTGQSIQVTVPKSRTLPELVPMIDGKTAADIMDAILSGTKIAYQKAELPYMEVVLEALDEHSLGAYLQYKMLEMMYLGYLLNVNSFDQPNVEAYKVETKRLLEQ